MATLPRIKNMIQVSLNFYYHNHTAEALRRPLGFWSKAQPSSTDNYFSTGKHLCLLSYVFYGHVLGLASLTMGLVLRDHQLRKCRLFQKLIWWWHFFIWGSLLPNASILCQIGVKLAGNFNFLLRHKYTIIILYVLSI